MKRLLFLSGLFITLIVASNFMAVKTIAIASIILPSAVILYPFCFALGDVINEYYGLKITRKVILFTFIFNAVAVLFLSIAAILPPSPFFSQNEGFKAIFLSAPRILVASFAAFLISSFLDSQVFSLFKKKGSLLVVRSAISSVLGITVDSIIFIMGAFLLTMPFKDVALMVLWQIIAKLIFGVAIGTPLVTLSVKLLPPLSQRDSEYFSE